MQFMALIYAEEGVGPKPGTPEFGAFMGAYMAFGETLKKDGAWIAGDALQGVDTATSVRVRDGKTETMDGPFAETKERLGGYYLFECADLDTALKYAAMIPSAAHGTIEVRAVMIFD
ncbi:MAG: YciI family protein [Paracoccaceae bacterium]